MEQALRILSENPLEQLWLHLSKWESQTLAQQLIAERAERAGAVLTPKLIEDKAQGLAYCLRNAREYLRHSEPGFNKRLLNSYYGLMSVIGAILISDPTTKYDLRRFEEATKMGHGLNNIDDPTKDFPEAQNVYITEDGLLVRYLRYLGINTSEIKMSGRYRSALDLTDKDHSKLISLDNLLATIPELNGIYYEITGRMPFSTEIFYPIDLNSAPESDTFTAIFDRMTRKEESVSEVPGGVWLCMGSAGILTEQVARHHLQLPFSHYQQYSDYISSKTYLAGFLECPDAHWRQHLPLYRSVMTGDVIGRPLLGQIHDPLAQHYTLMYALSIIVRYRPSLWREISEGRYDATLALLKYYYEVFARVIPQIALERLSVSRVIVMQPGSWNAPM